jgi:hypothetical protein
MKRVPFNERIGAMFSVTDHNLLSRAATQLMVSFPSIRQQTSWLTYVIVASTDAQ